MPKNAGLVTDEVVGTRRIYRLDPVAVSALRDQLDRVLEPSARRLRGRRHAATPESGYAEGGPVNAPVPSVRREVVVPVPIEEAFAAFTTRFGDFKPPEHNLLGVPIAETVFEAEVGGAILDRGADGSECRWARILAYEPPNRVIFSWDIGPTWQLETDHDHTSEVEVRFIAESADRTRLELEHRHLDRHGPGWPSLRDGVGGDQGCPHTSSATPRCSIPSGDRHRSRSTGDADFGMAAYACPINAFSRCAISSGVTSSR